MNPTEFETLLTQVAQKLTKEARAKLFTDSKQFENRVRTALVELGKEFAKNLNLQPPSQSFPDIVINDFGVEVKFTTNDTWRSVANSVFEGTRNPDVKQIYLIFGKMGGTPEVKWGKYDDCVMHVRTSHVPRFEVEIDTKRSLFQKMGTTYAEFCQFTQEDKMEHIRKYARGRLKEGERLWWLEDKEDSDHTLPIQARLYTSLEQPEKRKLRAEATLLCPQIVKSSRSKNKYDDVTLYILTYHGVLCSQARDLFSAGSVALRKDATRGGNYIMRALQDLESEMIEAAKYLDDRLFIEYWGVSVPPKTRISEWLKRADELAVGWQPSKELFKNYRA